MSAPRIRVPRAEVVLDTAPLRLRHWVALAAVLTAMIAASRWIYPDRLTAAMTSVSTPSWYSTNYNDDEARVYALTHSPATREAAVIVLGTSVTQASMWTDDVLSRQTGLNIVNLSTRGQSMLQSLFAAHSAQLRRGQLVVVAVSPSRATLGQDGNWRLAAGMYGPIGAFSREFLGQVPSLAVWAQPRTARYHDRSFHRQWVMHMVIGTLRHWSAVHLYNDHRAGYDQNRQGGGPDGSPVALRQSRLALRRRLDNVYDREREENQRLLSVLLRYVESRGARAILMNTPRIAGDTVLTYGPYWQKFRDDTRTVADANDVAVVDFVEDLALRAEEFRDASHTARAGRARWSRAFVQQVAQWCPASSGRSVRDCY